MTHGHHEHDHIGAEIDAALRTKALEALLVEKGLISTDAVDAVLRNSKIYKPIIAAINGPCVAGGMEMLGGIDIRIATEHATFGVMEPKRGLFAGGGTTVRLPRQLNYPAAMEFLLTAEQFPARRALELGLLNEIVGEEELQRRVGVEGGGEGRRGVRDPVLEYLDIVRRRPRAAAGRHRAVLDELDDLRPRRVARDHERHGVWSGRDDPRVVRDREGALAVLLAVAVQAVGLEHGPDVALEGVTLGRGGGVGRGRPEQGAELDRRATRVHRTR